MCGLLMVELSKRLIGCVAKQIEHPLLEPKVVGLNPGLVMYLCTWVRFFVGINSLDLGVQMVGQKNPGNDFVVGMILM